MKYLNYLVEIKKFQLYYLAKTIILKIFWLIKTITQNLREISKKSIILSFILNFIIKRIKSSK